jgi:large subunit ribosomal protein L23
MNSFEIIRTVRLTEKGTRQSSHPVRYTVKGKDGQEEIKTRPLNQYTVVADPRANKTQIRQAVQELFKVKVIKVNTLNVRGKYRRQRTKQAGKSSDWKKAIVTLKQGDKIVLT